MNYFTKITLLGLFLLTSNVFAQDDEEAEVQTGWTGAGELGFVKTTGNTDSAALNASWARSSWPASRADFDTAMLCSNRPCRSAGKGPLQ